uniref:Ig-like domain-containing protein n=1 Tax=Scleropages formosus TaxID=113540 RepID=A0A8C9UXH9_SCLFO
PLETKIVCKDAWSLGFLVTAQSGDSVTLTCDSTSFSYSSAVWFRHVAGQKTQFILATYQHSTDYAFYNGFNDTQRFTLQRKHNMFNLRISGTSTSDSGFYYCAFYGNKLDFHFGATSYLIITGNYESYRKSTSRTVVQQPVSDTVRPGDSVTLQCTVDSETCAGEHSVYWFRHGSGESLPGLIYTHGNRRDECEKSPEAGSPTHSCVYSLPKRNLSRSDAGIYYCAVVTCEDILFGNGTQLDIEGKSKLNVSHSKSFILNVTAQITVIFCSLLIYLVLSILLLQPGNTGRKARGGGDTPRTGRQSIARHPKRD